jgi:hypothetical protein
MSKVTKAVEEKVEPFNELACNCGAILEYIGSSQDAKHVYKTYKCPKCGNSKVIRE